MSAPALEQVVYRELRNVAGALFRRERGNHTLQPTALVHEAWLRLQAAQQLPASDEEGHRRFIGIAANLMRQILVDHARGQGSQKRGGDRKRIVMDEELPIAQLDPDLLLDLDAALTKLAARDERVARVAELRIFGGLGTTEIAAVLGVSPATIKTDWMLARAFVSQALDSAT